MTIYYMLDKKIILLFETRSDEGILVDYIKKYRHNI